MRAVIQRVAQAQVCVEKNIKGKIGRGFLILLGIESSDTEKEAVILAEKIVKLRVFSDDNGKMNLSLLDFQSCENPYRVLVISQFTLYACCRHGNRPDFLAAARPESANALYEKFISLIKEKNIGVETGVFGADMSVSLINDGPVTIILDTKDLKS